MYLCWSFPQVPQVDIEKLPVHLIKDNLSRHDKPEEDQDEHNDDNADENIHGDAKEDDIYSLELQENTEEFKVKGVI